MTWQIADPLFYLATVLIGRKTLYPFWTADPRDVLLFFCSPVWLLIFCDFVFPLAFVAFGFLFFWFLWILGSI